MGDTKSKRDKIAAGHIVKSLFIMEFTPGGTKMRTATVTALVDNPIGHLIEDSILQGGVDQSHVNWVNFDGGGRATASILPSAASAFAAACSDRGHTAVSNLRPGDIDWQQIFGREGVRWIHTGGIFAALSDTTPEVAFEAMSAAKQHGTIVSYESKFIRAKTRSLMSNSKLSRRSRRCGSAIH